MGKLQGVDPNEVNALFGSLPSTGPKYTQSVARPGEDLGKYDTGVNIYTTPDERRYLNYKNQTGAQAFGNALVQSLAEVTAGTVEGFGYLLDFEQHAKALVGAEKEFDNWLSESMRSIKAETREDFPINQNPYTPFNPLDTRFWYANLPSIVSTVSLMIPTGAAVGTLGKLGKLGAGLKASKGAQTIVSGALSRVMESTMEAAGNADNAVKEFMAKGFTEEEAKEKASVIAANTYYGNLPLVLADIFQYDILFKNKGLASSINTLQTSQAKKSLLENLTQSKASKVLQSMASEGAEEGYQFGIDKEAATSENPIDTVVNTIKNFPNYFEDPEFLTSVLVGAVGGGLFQALSPLEEASQERAPDLSNVADAITTGAQQLANSTNEAAKTAGAAIQSAFNDLGQQVSGAAGAIGAGITNTLDTINQRAQDVANLGLDSAASLGEKIKNTFNAGVERIKKLIEVNKKLEDAQLTGNEQLIRLEEYNSFHELLNNGEAEKFLQLGKNVGEDVTRYEPILSAYQKALLTHKQDQTKVDLEVQASIREQLLEEFKPLLEQSLAKLGTTEEQVKEQYYLKNKSDKVQGITPYTKNLPRNIKAFVEARLALEQELDDIYKALEEVIPSTPYQTADAIEQLKELPDGQMFNNIDDLLQYIDKTEGLDSLKEGIKKGDADVLQQLTSYLNSKKPAEPTQPSAEATLTNEPEVPYNVNNALEALKADAAIGALNTIDEAIEYISKYLPNTDLDKATKVKDAAVLDALEKAVENPLQKVIAALPIQNNFKTFKDLMVYIEDNFPKNPKLKTTDAKIQLKKWWKNSRKNQMTVEEEITLLPPFTSFSSFKALQEYIKESDLYSLQEAIQDPEGQVYKRLEAEFIPEYDTSAYIETVEAPQYKEQILPDDGASLLSKGVFILSQLFKQVKSGLVRDTSGKAVLNPNEFNWWTPDVERTLAYTSTTNLKGKTVYFETEVRKYPYAVTQLNLPVKIYVLDENNQKVYIGALQATNKSNNPALATKVRESAIKLFQEKKDGVHQLGSSKITNYKFPRLNTIPKTPLSQVLNGLPNRYGIYMGFNPKTNDYGKLNNGESLLQKVPNAVPGNFIYEIETPFGPKFIVANTKKLSEVPSHIEKLKEALAPIERLSKRVKEGLITLKEAEPLLKRELKTAQIKVWEIVFAKDENNIARFVIPKNILTNSTFVVDGVFNAEKFIEPMLDTRIQINAARLNEVAYMSALLDHIETTLDNPAFINPIIILDEKLLDSTALPKEAVEEKKVTKLERKNTRNVKFKIVTNTTQQSRLLSPNRATKYLKQVLPSSISVQVLDTIIRDGNIEAWGKVEEAVVTLSKLAPEGTEYHEAWHVIESILPEWLKAQIQKVGTEEERADLFMEWKLARPNRPGPLFRSFYNIWVMIKDLFKFRVTIEDVFLRIDTGFYKNASVKKLDKKYKVSGLTAKQHSDLLNVFINRVGQFYDLSRKEVIEKLIDENINKNGFLQFTEDSPLYDFVIDIFENSGYETANKILKYFRPDIGIRDDGTVFYEGEPTKGPIYASLLKDLGKRGYRVIVKNVNPIDFNEEGEVDLENTLEGWQEKAQLRSPIEKLSKRIKQFINSIESDEQDSLGLGLPLTYSGYEIYARLASILADSGSVEEMKQRLHNREEEVFKRIVTYIEDKYSNPNNIYTELFKALGDRNHPEYWVLQEAVGPNDSKEVRFFQANTAGLKKRIVNLVNNIPYNGDLKKYLLLIGAELPQLSQDKVEQIELYIKAKKGDQVYKLLRKSISNNFITSHLSVEGKKIYEIINGSFFGRFTAGLRNNFQRTVENIKRENRFFRELPILKGDHKPGDFSFIMFAGKKDINKEGISYENADAKNIFQMLFEAWRNQSIYPLPILSDSPNLIGTRYHIPTGTDVPLEIAKLVHLEHRRTLTALGDNIKNFKKNKREHLWFSELPYVADIQDQKDLVIQHYTSKVEALKKFMLEENIVGTDKQSLYSGFYSNREKKFKYPFSDDLLFDYLTNHALVYTQMSWLTVGDPAYYKNINDYFKRAKQIWSPIVRGSTSNNFNVTDAEGNVIEEVTVPERMIVKVIPDVEEPSIQDADLKKAGFNYGDVSKTDAQTFIDLHSYRHRMIYLQEWTASHQKLFEVLEKGISPYSDKGKEILGDIEIPVFNVLKPFYFDWQTTEQGFTSPVQKKDSETLILPIFGLETIEGKANPLFNPLYKEWLTEMGYDFNTMSYNLENRSIDVVTYDTTIKVGNIGDRLALKYESWGKQQETPAHHIESDGLLGTQISKLIMANLDGNASYNGYTSTELNERYNELVSQEIIDKYDELAKNITPEKIRRLLVEETINRGLRADYIDSMLSLPLNHPIHYKRVEQMLNSKVTKSVNQIKFEKGYSFANASSIGFARQPKIFWNMGEPKKGIKHFEVYAPIHDKRILKYIDPTTGLVDMELLENSEDAKLLDGLIYRVPTEDKYSMFPIRIIGFLPYDNGIIYMPDMVTKIAGLDFDIDKVRGVFLGGSKRQDDIIRLMLSVLNNPATLKNQLTPGGYPTLTKTNRIIRAVKNLGISTREQLDEFLQLPEKTQEDRLIDNFEYSDPTTLVKVARRMNTGKILIGPAANYNSIQALTQYKPIVLTLGLAPFVVKYNNKTNSSIGRLRDLDGNLIANNIKELVAAFVDNGKDPQAEYSNFTIDTINEALLLLMGGVPLDVVQMVFAQVKVGSTNNAEDLELNREDVLTALLQGGNPEKYTSYYNYLKLFSKQLAAKVGVIKYSSRGPGTSQPSNLLKRAQFLSQPVVLLESVVSETQLPENIVSTQIRYSLFEWAKLLESHLELTDIYNTPIGEAINIGQLFLTDASLEELYDEFFTFVASKHPFFAFDLKTKKKVEASINLFKQYYPENKFLQRLELNDGVLDFIGGNSNDEVEIQGLIDSWNDLLNQEPATYGNRIIDQELANRTKSFAEALIKYSFYKNGFRFGFGSFGHMIPFSWWAKNPEITNFIVENLKGSADGFIGKFVVNNLNNVQIKSISNENIRNKIKVLNNGDLVSLPEPYVLQEVLVPYFTYRGSVYKVTQDPILYQRVKPNSFFNKNKQLFKVYNTIDKVQNSVAITNDTLLEADLDKIASIEENPISSSIETTATQIPTDSSIGIEANVLSEELAAMIKDVTLGKTDSVFAKIQEKNTKVKNAIPITLEQFKALSLLEKIELLKCL